MKPSLLVPLIIVGFSIFFVSLWSGIVYLLSYLSGWQTLASQYRVQPRQEGIESNVYGRVGFVNYNGVLKVACTEQGLYLSVMNVFSLGHPPILIPWSSVHDIREQHLLFQATVVFNADSTRITLPSRFMTPIRQYTSGRIQPSGSPYS
ncbi:hypothetical protein IC229_20055 [Spirosoma sp. BT702]|uniref:Uncharacterized protein n=1 Tax=Spirosoma profusum TaxID=2771354 RepID=A0A926Y4B7_9BACT|nr:hypothetical protein [Spirosoma profusum]MBD2702951.1 hypothetical protein [Spirosoma profusum]